MMKKCFILLITLNLVCTSYLRSQDTTKAIFQAEIPLFNLDDYSNSSIIIIQDSAQFECPYTIEKAEQDIEQNSLKIVINIGFTGLGHVNEEKHNQFQKKYNVQFNYLGCVRIWDIEKEDTRGYNETIFEYLTQLHGDNVKQEFDEIWIPEHNTDFKKEENYNYHNGYEKLSFNSLNNFVKVLRSYSYDPTNEKDSTALFINKCSEGKAPIFKGYRNKVKFQLPDTVKKYQINCSNCNIYKRMNGDTLGPNTFYIVPKYGDSSCIEILTENEEIISYQLKNEVLPSPQVHFNDKSLGDKINFNHFEDTVYISAQFSKEAELCLDLGMRITHWKIHDQDGKVYISGSGNRILSQELWQIKGEKELFIECQVFGKDKITRRLKTLIDFEE